MADQIYTVGGLAKRLKDMLDGTYAEVVSAVMAAGTAIIGKVGIDQTTPATTNGVVLNAASQAGGVPSTARLASSAATTNAANVKTAAGRIYHLQGQSKAAYDVFIVLYDAVSNPPVPGTTAIRKKISIAAGSAFALDFANGLSFANGIGYAFTKLAADADMTALAVGDIIQFNMDYA